MRFDKFTTKFQQALSDAQSLAVGGDQQFIEPQHLLLALLNQDDGGAASLLSRAGVNVPALRSAPEAGARPACPRSKATAARCHWARSRQPAQPDRQGSAEARRPVHRLAKCSCSR